MVKQRGAILSLLEYFYVVLFVKKVLRINLPFWVSLDPTKFWDSLFLRSPSLLAAAPIIKASTTRNSPKTPTLTLLEVKMKIVGRVRPGVFNQDVFEDYELEDSGGHRTLAIFHQKLNSDPES